jgi:TRAP-type C4-dicarboxylate transport system permease small subunit
LKLLTVLSKRISMGIGIFGVFCIAAMMFYTTADLIIRYFYGKAMTGVIEVVSFMFLVTLYASLAYCQTRHSHIHMTLLMTVLPGKSKYLVWGLTSLISALMGFAITVASFIQMGIIKQQNEHSMLLWIPHYPFFFFGAMCMGVFSLCILLDCIKSFLALFKPEYAEEVSSTWS